MTIATITTTTDLVHGGCNACNTVNSVSYTLKISDKEVLLESLTVAALVMAIALHCGWQQEFKVEMVDEYLLFSKAQAEVKLVEEGAALTYSTPQKTLVTPNVFVEPEALFEQVNTIITTFFAIEPLQFTL